MIIEETERLIVKEIELNEAKEASGLLSLFPCETEKSYTLEMVEAYIKLAYGFYGYGYWGVYERETNSLVGIAGFREGSFPLEVGYVFREESRNKGYATEALKALVRFAEEEFMWVIEEQEEDEQKGKPLKDIKPDSKEQRVYVITKRDKVLLYGRTMADNIQSQRVMLKNGFLEVKDE